MRFFPKPPNMGFWRKWNTFCIMFTGGCLLAMRFYKDVGEVVESAEKLMWVGGGGIVLGLIMQICIQFRQRKNGSGNGTEPRDPK